MPNNDYISKLLEIKDLIVENIDNTNEEVHIYFKLERRYHCSSCNHHFKENFSLLPKHCRITTRLSFFAIHLLRENQNVSAVARQIGISPSSIFRRMADISYPKPSSLPQVLSIDEFRDNISNYFSSFKNRSNVKYFVMDMYPVYRDIAKRYFPNATIVIDKFHVVRYITRALENVRKRVQKDMHPSRRKYFKRSRRILLSHFDKLSDKNKDALEVMLSAQVSGLSQFNETLTMLGNWSKYILNAFDCSYTNGFTEGTNNKIKVIKRNAYGYRNFDNFRNRILLTSNLK